MSAHRLPMWQHTDTGLTLEVGQRRDRLPDPLADWLVGPGGIGLSGDPAGDLLRVERQVRHMIAQLSGEIASAERRIAGPPDQVAQPHSGRRKRRRLRRPRRAVGDARAARDVRAELVDGREHVRTVLDLLRTFVVELDIPHGLLREAADGWRRSSNPPPSVVVFDDEVDFLDTDPRRATTGDWGGPTTIHSEQFGLSWRRDGDEDVDDPAAGTPDDHLRRAGPWQIGYIGRTGEVYGIRRCTFLPQQVWLLGAGFDTPRGVRDVLAPIMPRITEPNSLILAAGTMHAAQTRLRSTTPRSTPAEPDGGNADHPEGTPAHTSEEASQWRPRR